MWGLSRRQWWCWVGGDGCSSCGCGVGHTLLHSLKWSNWLPNDPPLSYRKLVNCWFVFSTGNSDSNWGIDVHTIRTDWFLHLILEFDPAENALVIGEKRGSYFMLIKWCKLYISESVWDNCCHHQTQPDHLVGEAFHTWWLTHKTISSSQAAMHTNFLWSGLWRCALFGSGIQGIADVNRMQNSTKNIFLHLFNITVSICCNSFPA